VRQGNGLSIQFGHSSQIAKFGSPTGIGAQVVGTSFVGGSLPPSDPDESPAEIQFYLTWQYRKNGNKLAGVWASSVKYKHFSAECYTQLVSEVRMIELYRQWCVLESVSSELLADQRRLLRDIGRKLESDEQENFVLITSKAATPLHLDLLDKG
jgi:hypothetical protein